MLPRSPALDDVDGSAEDVATDGAVGGKGAASGGLVFAAHPSVRAFNQSAMSFVCATYQRHSPSWSATWSSFHVTS